MAVIEDYLKKVQPLVDKEIEKVFPKKLSNKWWDTAFDKPDFAYDLGSLQKALAEPVWDLLERGGKRWRPGLLLLACEAVGGTRETALKFTPLIEVIHNGTLVHDDIEDSSETRRGKPCTYKLFGVDISVNVGSAMYFLPLVMLYANTYNLTDSKKTQLYDLIIQELLKCHVGQALDICWHNGGKYDISEKEYLQMCAFKTGTLARLAAKLGAAIGNANEKQIISLGKFAETVGVAFQIQDDILNLAGEEFQKGKGVGEDIHEGKRTIMVLHSLKNAEPKDKQRLLDILNAHPSDQQTINEAIDLIKKTDSIDYAREKAKELVKDAWKKLDTELKETEAKQTLKKFADYLIERKI